MNATVQKINYFSIINSNTTTQNTNEVDSMNGSMVLISLYSLSLLLRIQHFEIFYIYTVYGKHDSQYKSSVDST
jgi:hypothetical protein